MLTVTQELDGAPAQVLARHAYTELGQLDSKQLGGRYTASTPLPLSGAGGPAAWQTVDFRYNIRGWLMGINDIDAVNPADGDLWSFALSYDCGFETPQYNGNIAGQRWRSASDGVQRAYGYRYDPLNRLLQGDFVARAAGPDGTWGAERMSRVDDLAPAPTAFGPKLPERPDFSDGPTSGATTPDYTYDAAGSLSSDANKGIKSIRYNYLHLPERLE